MVFCYYKNSWTSFERLNSVHQTYFQRFSTKKSDKGLPLPPTILVEIEREQDPNQKIEMMVPTEEAIKVAEKWGYEFIQTKIADGKFTNENIYKAMLNARARSLDAYIKG